MIFRLTFYYSQNVNFIRLNKIIALLHHHFNTIEYESMDVFEIVFIALDESIKYDAKRPRYQAHQHYYQKFLKEYIDINGEYTCYYRFTPEEYDVLVNGSDEDANKVIARGVVDSLSNLDRLSRKAAAFDKDHFRAEVVKLFKENDLIPDDYPLPWSNKKKRTRTRASQDLG